MCLPTAWERYQKIEIHREWALRYYPPGNSNADVSENLLVFGQRWNAAVGSTGCVRRARAEENTGAESNGGLPNRGELSCLS